MIVMMRTFAMPTWLTAASVKEPIWIQDLPEDMVGNIRIYHEREGRIENSFRGSPFGITRLAE